MKAYINGIRVIPTEEEEQTALFSWAVTQESVHPELKLMFHIPNGGKRGKAEAARFKAAGVKAGVPDIFLPVARGRYYGLWIEMKAKDGTATEAQWEWMGELDREGYAVKVCYGFEEAVRVLVWYLGLTEVQA